EAREAPRFSVTAVLASGLRAQPRVLSRRQSRKRSDRLFVRLQRVGPIFQAGRVLGPALGIHQAFSVPKIHVRRRVIAALRMKVRKFAALISRLVELLLRVSKRMGAIAAYDPLHGIREATR